MSLDGSAGASLAVGWAGWLLLVATATATCRALACSAKTKSGQHPNLDFL